MVIFDASDYMVHNRQLLPVRINVKSSPALGVSNVNFPLERYNATQK